MLVVAYLYVAVAVAFLPLALYVLVILAYDELVAWAEQPLPSRIAARYGIQAHHDDPTGAPHR